MRDEDLLRKVIEEGKVTIGGKEFPIKPVKPETIVAHDPNFEREYFGTFSNPSPFGNDRNEPSYPELFVSKLKPRAPYQNDDRPEVALREGIRAALRGGLSAEKIKEIFEHELVFGVMES